MSCSDGDVTLTSIFVCASGQVALCEGKNEDGDPITYAFDLEVNMCLFCQTPKFDFIYIYIYHTE